jgi:hypothetical protein
MNTLIELADAYARNCFSDGVHDTVIEHPHTKKARAALVQGIEALQRKNEALRSLLDEVSANCTRDDDLPDGLLGRIDAAIGEEA